MLLPQCLLQTFFIFLSVALMIPIEDNMPYPLQLQGLGNHCFPARKTVPSFVTPHRTFFYYSQRANFHKDFRIQLKLEFLGAVPPIRSATHLCHSRIFICVPHETIVSVIVAELESVMPIVVLLHC